MSKPPKLPTRPASPATSALSLASDVSSVNTELKNVEPGGQSPASRELYEAFESAVPFSQLDEIAGRGSQVITQTIGVMSQIWAGRDLQNPSLCFDKHDGRTGTRIYIAPKRGPGGVIIPCSLDGTTAAWSGTVQSINIVNHNIAMQSLNHSVQVPVMQMSPQRSLSMRRETVKNKDGRKNRQIQLTLKNSRVCKEKACLTKKSNKGRFTKKSIVSAEELRTTAPSIPLNTRSLRRLLKQCVEGDSERGLMKPLAEFSTKERNGNDRTGKPNKTIISKRRTVALATLLALQEALDGDKSFSEAIGISATGEDVDKMPLSEWERAAKSFLKKGSRRMSIQEVIDLGKKMYCKVVIDMLPIGNE